MPTDWTKWIFLLDKAKTDDAFAANLRSKDWNTVRNEINKALNDAGYTDLQSAEIDAWKTEIRKIARDPTVSSYWSFRALQE